MPGDTRHGLISGTEPDIAREADHQPADAPLVLRQAGFAIALAHDFHG